MNKPFSTVLFENAHYIWLMHFILLTYQYIFFFIQNHTKIKNCVIIAVKYACMCLRIFVVLVHLSQRLKCEIGAAVQRNTDGDTP